MSDKEMLITLIELHNSIERNMPYDHGVLHKISNMINELSQRVKGAM